MEIKIDDFAKIEIRIGKILEAEKIEGADKLLRLQVDFGPSSPVIASLPADEAGGAKQSIDGIASSLSAPRNDERIKRQILAGIAQYYAPEALIGKECPFVYNLSPRTLRGFESQGMILCPSDATSGPVLLHPDKEVPPGSLVK
jgi:tRNA-binding EMAP/Myf-like protein